MSPHLPTHPWGWVVHPLGCGWGGGAGGGGGATEGAPIWERPTCWRHDFGGWHLAEAGRGGGGGGVAKNGRKGKIRSGLGERRQTPRTKSGLGRGGGTAAGRAPAAMPFCLGVRSGAGHVRRAYNARTIRPCSEAECGWWPSG